MPDYPEDPTGVLPAARAYAGMSGPYPLYWRVKAIRPEWFGRACRIVVHGRRGNRLIEFADGERVVCPGNYLRRKAA